MKEKHKLFKMSQECLSVDTGKRKKPKKPQKNQACKKNCTGS